MYRIGNYFFDSQKMQKTKDSERVKRTHIRF